MTYDKIDLCGQVKERIIERIAHMNRQGQDKLPPENTLAKELEVSRSTIRTVLATLEDEGKLFRRHGKGTYINPYSAGISTTLYPQVYYTDLISLSGYQPSIEVLGVEILPAGALAGPLRIHPEQSVVEVRKVYRADDQLCIYCVDTFPLSLIDPALLDILKTWRVSIFQFFSQYTDIKIEWDMVELQVSDIQRSPELAPYFGEIKSFLVVEGSNFDGEDVPVLHSYSYINTDIIQYQLVRGRIGAEKRLL